MSETAENRIQKELLNMMKDMPVEQIYVKQLCHQAGVSRSTFYAYYESVYDVLQDIEDRIMSEQIAFRYTMNTEGDEVKQGIHEIIQFTMDHLEEYQALLGRYGDPAFKARWSRMIGKKLRLHHFYQGEAPDEYERCITWFVTGGIQNMISSWLLYPKSISTETIEHIIYVNLTQVFPILKQK